MKEYPLTHQKGSIEINHEAICGKGVEYLPENDFGIQIDKDGRIWICVDGVSFIRFRPIKEIQE